MSILHEAKIMLETVMRLYYARHSFDFYDPWIAFALTAVGNGVIADLATGSSTNTRIVNGYRSTLILCAIGLNKQGLNYYISMLLAIQLRRAMKPEDLGLLKMHATDTHIEDEDQALVAEHAHSQWPVPGMAMINEDPEGARLRNLVRAFDDVQIQPSVVSTDKDA